MRTIKFRGRRIDNGEWVYGYFVGTTDSVAIIIPFEKVNYDIGYIGDSECCYCFPETIGQFTGLHDKNGKEIYEGDIIIEKLKRSRKYSERLVICFDGFEWQGKNEYGSTTSLSLLSEYHTFEVIGNIHDNPELLKGGKE